MPSPSPELKHQIVLRAGAGAGKTTTLVSVFLQFASEFLENHKKFPKVVVTTFTRKATQELKERLLKKALEEKREDLFHFVSSQSSVQISTIHGILNLFLGRYGSSMGLTPDYKIISESENRRAIRKILRKIILERPHLQELLEEYDFKTLEMNLMLYFQAAQTQKSLNFADAKYFAQVAQAFVRSLGERARQVSSLILAQGPNDKWRAYLESLASVAWDNREAVESFYEHASKPNFIKSKPPFDESLNEELESVRQDIKNYVEKKSYQASFWERHEKNATGFDEVAREFTKNLEQQKLEQGLLSMSDLETFSCRLIRQQPEAAQAFAKEWDFWMIDEYQDTSPLQVELMKSLIGDRPSFIVGDPQQSIYLFRGARSEVFHEREREVAAAGGEVQQKLINYRSSPEVLRFINSYFTRLDSQFSAMEVDPQKKDSHSEEFPLQILRLEEGQTEHAESEAAIGRVQELLKQGVSPEKIAILARTHSVLEDAARAAQSYGVPVQLHSGSGFYERREVVDALQFLKFLLNPHDNYNFIAVLRSPWFHLADQEILKFCHDYKSSFWRTALNKVKSTEAQHPVTKLKTILSLSESLGLAWSFKRALIDFKYFDYSCKIDPSGRREANLWKIVALLSQEERRPGFNFLDFIENGLETLSTESESMDADATPVIEPKRLNLMTIHASKGLQFDHVILLGMGKNQNSRQDARWRVEESSGLWTLPVRDDETQVMSQSLLAEKIMTEMQEREAHEFNRVLYVALTRAKFGISLLMVGKPGGRSWTTTCPLDLSEGEHVEEGFQYLVRTEPPLPQKEEQVIIESEKIRKVWKEVEAGDKEKTLSVTDLISSFAVANAPSEGSAMLEGLRRAQQGTDAHRFFEALKYNSLDQLKRHLPAPLQRAIQYISQQKEVPLLQIIEEGHVEWGFAYRHQERLVQGQIDLWGQIGETLWILDYKTGSQKYSEAAFAQMTIYAWAILRMNQVRDIKNIKLAAVYPLDEKIKVREFESSTDLEIAVSKIFPNA